ncbi:hypothetical protein J5J83_07115 [Azoarcus sp. L1K30]|uniref:DUF7931 domain-containing protein n=1 Tax=Azoarcus sp. L1K30 TaxID=2820277 RepID=UPI001B833F67|nr:hypothetical protein [Azoarcus sp. L1K30]MBR0565880.1 hypothetical protein [Azoarcus sp. L1K30]
MAEPLERAIDSWAAYRSALIETVDRASSSLLIFDPDLAETGFEHPAGVDTLKQLLLRSAQLVAVRILLQDSGFLERQCARLLTLLGQYNQKIEIRLASDPRALPDAAFVVADGVHLVTRFHSARPRGKCCVDDARSTAPLIAQFETLWVSATPGPSGVQLGL